MLSNLKATLADIFSSAKSKRVLLATVGALIAAIGHEYLGLAEGSSEKITAFIVALIIGDSLRPVSRVDNDA